MKKHGTGEVIPEPSSPDQEPTVDEERQEREGDTTDD